MKLKCRWLQKDRPALKTVDFLRILENIAFSRFSRFLKFISYLCLNDKMHFILSEHCRPNAIELDKSIFDNKSFTTAEHFRFQYES